MYGFFRQIRGPLGRCDEEPMRRIVPVLRRNDVPFRRFHINRCLLDFVPVGRQGGSTRFDEALHHGPSRIFVSARIELLEEPVEGRISTGVGVLVGRLVFVLVQNLRGDLVPVLVLLARFEQGLVRRSRISRRSWLCRANFRHSAPESDIRVPDSPSSSDALTSFPQRPSAFFWSLTSTLTFETV